MQFMPTIIDYGIAIIVLFSMVIAIARGLIREAFSLATWIIAFWVTIRFGESLSLSLKSMISHDSVRLLASYLILFTVTLLIGSILGYLVSQLVSKTGMGGTDRLLGMVFGFARGCLLVALLVVFGGLTHYPEQKSWKNSVLLPYFKPLSTWLSEFFPKNLKDKEPVTDN